MNLEKKLLLFYLGLDNFERKNFKSYVSPRKFEQLFATIHELSSDIDSLGAPRGSSKNIKNQEKDLALMQIMKYLINSNKSNVDFAEAIQDLTNEKVSRPEKRGRYELKGMLLEYLLTAKNEDLMSIRNALVHLDRKEKESTTNVDTNLEKWFNIILANTK